MVKITNPLTKSIYVIFEGTKYEIDAESSITVQPGVAAFWVKIHPFIKVEKVVESAEVEATAPGSAEVSDDANTEADQDADAATV